MLAEGLATSSPLSKVGETLLKVWLLKYNLSQSLGGLESVAPEEEGTRFSEMYPNWKNSESNSWIEDQISGKTQEFDKKQARIEKNKKIIREMAEKCRDQDQKSRRRRKLDKLIAVRSDTLMCSYRGFSLIASLNFKHPLILKNYMKIMWY